ncbi:N/A [soil metagenome]
MLSLARTQGFILISIMIYLVILSLLALGALEASALQTRMSNNIKDSDKLFICAEAALQKSKNILASNIPKKCLIEESTNNYYRDKNATWWQTYACNVKVCNSYKTFYLIENLAEQSCCKISNHRVGCRYYRITARTGNNDDSYQTILQSTILLPFTTREVCPVDKIKLQRGGQQSWRQIY